MLTMQEIHDAEVRRWTERYEQLLDQVPMLLEHLRTMANPLKAGSLGERVTGGGGEAPAPVRLDPVDDADDLWAGLIEYTLDVAHRLHEPAPAAAGDTWTARGSVQGLPAHLDADGAYRAAWEVVGWLIDRAPRIHPLALTDSEQHLFGLVRKLVARYVTPPIERPSHRRECSVCGERAVVVSWVIDDTGEARCAVCGAVYSPDQEVE